MSAILQAGRELLEAEGSEAVTTNRIAERAGVSIGSLYRYFPNKEAVLACLYDSDADGEVRDLPTSADWPPRHLGLRGGLAQLVDFQLDRHRRLLDLEGTFYRDHHRDFSLARRMGSDEVELMIRNFLAHHADAVRVRDVDQAAFLVARGVSAVLRLALDECPQKLAEESFRKELVDLLVAYVSAPR